MRPTVARPPSPVRLTMAMRDLDALDQARDHFELFGLPRAYGLDAGALERAYIELTRATHPDFAGSDVEDQARAMELSARVNEGHRVLADPEARANYLLELLGGAAREEDKSLPPGFLERMLAIREEMADAQLEGDAPKLAEMESFARREQASHVRRLTELFARPSPDLPAIRTELNAMRYIQRMLEQIRPDAQIM